MLGEKKKQTAHNILCTVAYKIVFCIHVYTNLCSIHNVLEVIDKISNGFSALAEFFDELI